MLFFSFLFQHGLFDIPPRRCGACTKPCSFSPIASLATRSRVIVPTHTEKQRNKQTNKKLLHNALQHVPRIQHLCFALEDYLRLQSRTLWVQIPDRPSTMVLRWLPRVSTKVTIRTGKSYKRNPNLLSCNLCS